MADPYPHLYEASAAGAPSGLVSVTSRQLETISTAPPKEFGGPGDRWSPEALLVGAIADCFVLTLRAIARARALQWLDIECRVEGVLENIAGVTQFSRFVTHARLRVPPGTNEADALRLLERAEKGCLIANSLRGERHLEAQVVVSAAEAVANVG